MFLTINGTIWNSCFIWQASEKDPRTKVEGDVKQLKSIPFDYREQHADLFTKEAMQSMIDKVVNNGHTSNSGNGNIVPIITNNNAVNKITGEIILKQAF